MNEREFSERIQRSLSVIQKHLAKPGQTDREYVAEGLVLMLQNLIEGRLSNL